MRWKECVCGTKTQLLTLAGNKNAWPRDYYFISRPPWLKSQKLNVNQTLNTTITWRWDIHTRLITLIKYVLFFPSWYYVLALTRKHRERERERAIHFTGQPHYDVSAEFRRQCHLAGWLERRPRRQNGWDAATPDEVSLPTRLWHQDWLPLFLSVLDKCLFYASLHNKRLKIPLSIQRLTISQSSNPWHLFSFTQ